MIGVIAGDVIGSVHEHALTKSTDFPLFDPHCRFTDDTVRARLRSAIRDGLYARARSAWYVRLRRLMASRSLIAAGEFRALLCSPEAFFYAN